jgi:hypothetical protein
LAKANKDNAQAENDEIRAKGEVLSKVVKATMPPAQIGVSGGQPQAAPPGGLPQ